MENETSYVAIAGAKITRVGCGRAMYSVDLDESTGEVEVADAIAAPEAASREAEATGNKNENSHTRVEVLICNYGPIDRATPQNLYEYGSLQVCPAGSLRSQEYDHLCSKWKLQCFLSCRKYLMQLRPAMQTEKDLACTAKFY